MSQRNGLYKQLFGIAEGEAEVEDESIDKISRINRQTIRTISDTNKNEDMFNKLYWMRLIVSVATRLSLIASVWLFLFDYHKWYGIPLFFLLTLLAGGVRDRPDVPSEENIKRILIRRNREIKKRQ